MVAPAAEEALGGGLMWADVSATLFSARVGHTATLWRDCVLVFGGRHGCVVLGGACERVADGARAGRRACAKAS
jgi:hypothetical protein